jgi:hypothetical protein
VLQPNGGNVGFGLSNPSYPLHVNATGNGTKARFTNGTTTLDLYCGGTEVYTGTAGSSTSWAYANANTYIAGYVNGSEKMRLDSSGNLGLGVTPSAWNLSGLQALQIKNASLSGYLNNAYLSANTYYSGGWNYIATAVASQYVQTNGQHQFFNAVSGTAGTAITFTQAMTLDASGNLGLNGAPNAWGTSNSVKAFQLPGVSIWGFNSVNAYFSANSYYNGTNRIYINTNFATEYAQTSGQHQWYTAPSGTAGNAITFTQAMTLDASGRQLLGHTSSQGNNSRLQISGGTESFGSQGSNAILTTQSFFNTNSSGFAIAQMDVLTGTNIYEGVFRWQTKDVGGTMAERARITSGGNVGIGTNNPIGKLTIDAPDTLVSPTLSMRNSGNTYGFDFDSETVSIGRLDLYAINASVRSQVMTWRRGSGNVGIATTTPEAKLHIVVSPSSAAFIATDNISSDFFITPGVSTSVCRVGPSSGAMAFYTVNTEKARIDSSGNLLVGATAAETYTNGSSTQTSKLQSKGVANLGPASSGLVSSTDTSGGSLFRQTNWSGPATSLTIPYASIGAIDNSGGMITATATNKVSGAGGGVGTILLIWTKNSGNTVAVTTVSSLVTGATTTISASVSGNNLVITSDANSYFAWTSISAG